ncbi:MAG: DUF2169 domain-containing protein [Candidatus Thiodiazotropha sp.]
MLELDNQSLWQAALYPAWNAKREPQLTLVVKTGFWFDKRGKATAMDSVPAIEEEDRHHDDPLSSSLAASCESVPYKQGSELICYGTAQPPEADATVMEVKIGLRRGEADFWNKALRVSGPRQWRRGLLSSGPSEPETLQPLPLRYESAYGGRDPRNSDHCYEANPVGMGFTASSRYHPELAVPQIELGPDYLRTPTQRPEPAGFAPLPVHWLPRLELTPEIDEEAVTLGLCPFAEEIAADFYNAAPKDQRFDTPFEGGETLFLQGLVDGADPRGMLIKIPKVIPEVLLVRSEREQSRLTLSCDTLVVRADERELHLLWRCAIPVLKETQGWIVIRPPQPDEHQHADNDDREQAA